MNIAPGQLWPHAARQAPLKLHLKFPKKVNLTLKYVNNHMFSLRNNIYITLMISIHSSQNISKCTGHRISNVRLMLLVKPKQMTTPAVK
jgi:hypothetical protein